MPDDPHLPEPPSDDEIEARLRRAVERSFQQPVEEEDESPEAVEARFRRLQEELAGVGLPETADDAQPRRPRAPEDDPEFAAQLDALHNRADKARSAYDTSQQHKDRELGRDRASARGLGVGLSIGYTIVGLPLVGVAIGWLLDSQFGTNLWKGLLALAGAVLGIVMAIMTLNRTDPKS
jgi:F0F1-type ATP synthase assembly protein I